MKQLKQAIRDVEAEKCKPPVSSKNTKKNAKRKQKKKAAASLTAVPGTSAGVAVSTGRSATFSMSHREYLGQLVVDAGKSAVNGAFVLQPYSFPWLSNMSKCFEKYQWTSLVLEYNPDVGTTKDGSVAWGIDWGDSNATVELRECPLTGIVMPQASYDRKAVVALTPSTVVPLWRPTKMVVPAGVLQTRKWYAIAKSAQTALDDYAPGSLAYYVSAAAGTVGDVWASYRVVFAGTRVP